nr:hypothetical protein [Escherichia coli]
MLVLGYDPEQFEAIDRHMCSGSRMGEDKHKIDRYGKKYGWIAYFEMWGLRYAQGLLSEDRSARPSDADIDPTFPLDAVSIDLPLPALFSEQSSDDGDWIMRGPQPDYRSILEITEIDGLTGPWILLDGFVEQNATSDDRQIFTFLRGVFVDSQEVDNLCRLFTDLEYPGNSAIPDAPVYYYTYVGEMPFSSIPGLLVANEQEDDSDENLVSADRWSGNGVAVDITVQNYNWESYHSVENQSSGASLPSKQLCEALNLRYRANTWDLHDAAGVAVAGGVMINEAMAQILIFPFGSELAAFCGALTTGILGLVMNYYLEYSEVMQRVWAFLDKFKDRFQRPLEYFQAVNAELDRYLVELTALEFSVDAAALNHFSLHLDSVNSEIKRGLLLREEVSRRGIALPFESGNVASVRDWLNKR